MTTPDNWQLFAEFCAAELAAGGPDPQMAMMEYLSRGQEPIERVWMAGCYGAHHCVASAYAVWKDWRPMAVIQDQLIGLEAWLEDHWDCLPVRPEMRSHRMVEKRASCLGDFAQYSVDSSWSRCVSYDSEWKHSIGNVSYYNRYMAIKFLEMLRMKVNPALVIPDMRAKGAWSPRIALGMLFPEANDILADKSKNGPEHVALTERYAALARERLAERNVHVSFFQIQVLMCEFREALVGGYYPGASLDEEMELIEIAEGDFDMSAVWEARKALFPHHLLGELNGWHGIRKDMYKQFKGASTYERI